MVSILRSNGTVAECPAMLITHIYDRLLEFKSIRTYPWCTPGTLEWLNQELNQLPARLPSLPILVEKENGDDVQLTEVLTDEFPCPHLPLPGMPVERIMPQHFGLGRNLSN